MKINVQQCSTSAAAWNSMSTYPEWARLDEDMIKVGAVLKGFIASSIGICLAHLHCPHQNFLRVAVGLLLK